MIWAAGDVARGAGLLASALGCGVLLVWLARSYAEARARHEWMARWGEPHGLRLVGDPGEPPGSTALLRQHDRRILLDAVVGPIAGDDAGMLCHYTSTEESDKSSQDHEYTLCVLSLPATAAALPLLTAQPRGITGGLFDRISGALSRSRVVEHESVGAHRAFRIAVDDRQDELVLRRVLTPSFLVWLEGQAGSDLRFELEQGALVVALPGHSFEADRLDWLLGAGTEIARRLAVVPQHSSQEARP